ncbi:TetR/AcrR family transcriptional regulator [Roseomonas sp. BN140053]|uniref:TetR/AcrR family transcriptional regulator n=1 Tax=Roseomonas sp. BN140053 TaxID=3391898 RepID=UPI0039E9B953
MQGAKPRDESDKPGPEAGPSSRERILAAAAWLFAERGLAAVGLRAITAEAGVNLAAVNYHFGSKEGLLEALFETRAQPIAEARLRLLGECRDEPGRPPLLEQLLDAFLRPAFTLGVEPALGGAAFVRLRARLAAETEAMAGRILQRAFDQSSGRFLDAIAAALPDLPRAEVEWRFHFLLGTMVYTMANNGRIQSLTHGSCDPGDLQQALRNLIPFVAAGFRSAPLAAPASAGPRSIPNHQGDA